MLAFLHIYAGAFKLYGFVFKFFIAKNVLIIEKR